MFPILLLFFINSSHLIKIEVMVADGVSLFYHAFNMMLVKFMDIRITLLLNVDVGSITPSLLDLLLDLVRVILGLVIPIDPVLLHSICKFSYPC